MMSSKEVGRKAVGLGVRAGDIESYFNGKPGIALDSDLEALYPWPIFKKEAHR